MYTVQWWLTEKNIIQFLVKARELGGKEYPVFILPQHEYGRNSEIIKLMKWEFEDEEKGKEFYEWGIKNYRK